MYWIYKLFNLNYFCKRRESIHSLIVDSCWLRFCVYCNSSDLTVYTLTSYCVHLQNSLLIKYQIKVYVNIIKIRNIIFYMSQLFLLLELLMNMYFSDDNILQHLLPYYSSLSYASLASINFLHSLPNPQTGPMFNINRKK